MRQATVYIDRQALQYNLNRVKQLAANSKIVSMVKANAYGHGVKDCLAALNASDAFGVACLQEGLEIRELGFEQPVTLIEGVFSEDEMPVAIEQKFECVIHHQQQFEWLIKHKQAYIAQGLKVWVKLNSGMNRLGFKNPEIIEVIKTLKSEGFTCVLAMHFANADVDHPLNEQQKQQFLHIKETCDPILASCCNSAAIFKWPELNFDYVRPGIMLYGVSPFRDRTQRCILRPASCGIHRKSRRLSSWPHSERCVLCPPVPGGDCWSGSDPSPPASPAWTSTVHPPPSTRRSR